MIAVENYHIKFIINESGKKTHLVIPVEEFNELMEDLQDMAVVESRKDDEEISLDEALKSLRINE